MTLAQAIVALVLTVACAPFIVSFSVHIFYEWLAEWRETIDAFRSRKS